MRGRTGRQASSPDRRRDVVRHAGRRVCGDRAAAARASSRSSRTRHVSAVAVPPDAVRRGDDEVRHGQARSARGHGSHGRPEMFRESEFAVFERAVEGGAVIRAIRAPGAADTSRSFFDKTVGDGPSDRAWRPGVYRRRVRRRRVRWRRPSGRDAGRGVRTRQAASRRSAVHRRRSAEVAVQADSGSARHLARGVGCSRPTRTGSSG